MVKLTDDLSRALADGNGQPIAVEDERTRRRYFIVDEETHQQAMRALREKQVVSAIEEGIADFEMGQTHTVGEADAHIRAELGFPPRKP